MLFLFVPLVLLASFTVVFLIRLAITHRGLRNTNFTHSTRTVSTYDPEARKRGGERRDEITAHLV